MARTYQLLRSKTGRKGMRVSLSIDVAELRKGLRMFRETGREGYLGKLAELMEGAANKADQYPGLAKWRDPEHVAEALRVAAWLFDEADAETVSTCRRCSQAFDRGYPDPEEKPYRYDAETLCFPCYERIMDARTAHWTGDDLVAAFGGRRRAR